MMAEREQGAYKKFSQLNLLASAAMAVSHYGRFMEDTRVIESYYDPDLDAPWKDDVYVRQNKWENTVDNDCSPRTLVQIAEVFKMLFDDARDSRNFAELMDRSCARAVKQAVQAKKDHDWLMHEPPSSILNLFDSSIYNKCMWLCLQNRASWMGTSPHDARLFFFQNKKRSAVREMLFQEAVAANYMREVGRKPCHVPIPPSATDLDLQLEPIPPIPDLPPFREPTHASSRSGSLDTTVSLPDDEDILHTPPKRKCRRKRPPFRSGDYPPPRTGRVRGA